MPEYPGTAWQITDDRVLAQYFDTACWSSPDDDKELFAHRLTKAARKTMEADLRDFLEANAEDIGDRQEEAAHDFWLTRNGHGAGFWDGDWPEPAASRLTTNSKAYGEVYLTSYRGWIYHS